VHIRIIVKKQKRKLRVGKPNAPPGPKPELFKIEGNWKDAVKRALKVKRPAGGWPKPEARVKRGES
jgi:hypothetical protein